MDLLQYQQIVRFRSSRVLGSRAIVLTLHTQRWAQLGTLGFVLGKPRQTLGLGLSGCAWVCGRCQNHDRALLREADCEIVLQRLFDRRTASELPGPPVYTFFGDLWSIY